MNWIDAIEDKLPGLVTTNAGEYWSMGREISPEDIRDLIAAVRVMEKSLLEVKAAMEIVNDGPDESDAALAYDKLTKANKALQEVEKIRS